jgi:hypothetical protein
MMKASDTRLILRRQLSHVSRLLCAAFVIALFMRTSVTLAQSLDLSVTKQTDTKSVAKNCMIFCEGCGCRGGYGYKTKGGICVTRAQFKNQCGESPDTKCFYEGTPLDVRCVVEQSVPIIVPPDKPHLSPAVPIVIIDSGYSWSYRRADRLGAKDEMGNSTAIMAQLSARLEDSHQLIAIGLSSAEGAQPAEDERARLRARQLASWLKKTIAGDRKLWTLSLGKHHGDCKQCTAESSAKQRALIVIGVKQNLTEVDIEGAVRTALQSLPNLLSSNDYGLFELIQYDGSRP